MLPTKDIAPRSLDAARTKDVAQRVLENLARYRLLTPAAVTRIISLHGAASPADWSQRATDETEVEQVLSHLRQHDLVGVDSLYQREKYYYLTERAAQLSGGVLTDLPERWCGPLPETAKIVNYAVLAFCVLGEKERRRLTRRDIREHFAGVDRPGLPLNYYVDLGAAPPRLGFIRVDTGGRGRWDRVLAKAQDDWRKHVAQPPFRQFIAQGQFEVAIVTALPQKAERIREAVADSNKRMAIHVAAVPELVHVVIPG